MEWLTTEALVALMMLTMLEIILGIDNVVFISILTGKLPEKQRPKATIVGLGAALAMRVVLLIGLKWIMGLVEPLFDIAGRGISTKDLILLLGGAFLVGKATYEIHHNVENHGRKLGNKQPASFAGVIAHIMVLDMIFSLDSVITAVGMANQLWVMITAVVISIAVMMVFANPISSFVQRHPAMKLLALAFLVLIGVALAIEGAQPDPIVVDGEVVGEHHGFKGYIYAAMGFALAVELLQLRMAKNAAKHADQPTDHEDAAAD